MKKFGLFFLTLIFTLGGLCGCSTTRKLESTMQLSLSDIKVWVSDGFLYNYGDVIVGEEKSIEKSFDNETIVARFVYEVPVTTIGYYNSPKVAITRGLSESELEQKIDEGYTTLTFSFAFEKTNPSVETRNRLYTADMNILNSLNGEYSNETFRGKKAADFMEMVETYQGRLLNHWYTFSYQLTDIVKHYDLFTNYMPLVATGTINIEAGTVYLSDFVFSN